LPGNLFGQEIEVRQEMMSELFQAGPKRIQRWKSILYQSTNKYGSSLPPSPESIEKQADDDPDSIRCQSILVPIAIDIQ
jgi:hypothetical protein